MTIRATVLHLIARALDIDVSELHDGCVLTWFEAHEMDLSELAMDLEADLGVEVPDDEVERWVTVGDVVRCLERLKKGEKAEEREKAPLSKKRGKPAQGSLL